MLKFILILILLVYAFYKVSSFLFKFLFGGTSQEQFHSYRGNRRRAPDSNLNVDRVPRSKKKKSGYKGGEYVDFEEIK